MCDDITYGLPLALIIEEILELEKPNKKSKNKEQVKTDKEEGAAL